MKDSKRNTKKEKFYQIMTRNNSDFFDAIGDWINTHQKQIYSVNKVLKGVTIILGFVFFIFWTISIFLYGGYSAKLLEQQTGKTISASKYFSIFNKYFNIVWILLFIVVLCLIINALISSDYKWRRKITISDRMAKALILQTNPEATDLQLYPLVGKYTVNLSSKKLNKTFYVDLEPILEKNPKKSVSTEAKSLIKVWEKTNEAPHKLRV